MEMVNVDSSQIFAVGFEPDQLDPSKGTINVRFRDRRTGGPSSLYEYPGQSQENFDSLVAADSVGRYFAAHLKWSNYRKLE